MASNALPTSPAPASSLPPKKEDKTFTPAHLSHLRNTLASIQQWNRDTSYLARHRRKRKKYEQKLSLIYATPLGDLTTKARITVWDAENLWMRILHDSKVPSAQIKTILLDDGAQRQTYRGVNVYRLFEKDVSGDEVAGSIEQHRARFKFCVSIHIIRQRESMTTALLEQWFERVKTHLKEEYTYRPQTHMKCVLSCGTRAWFRCLIWSGDEGGEKTGEEQEKGTFVMDSVCDDWEETAGARRPCDPVDLSAGFGVCYAKNFLERAFEEAGNGERKAKEGA